MNTYKCFLLNPRASKAPTTFRNMTGGPAPGKLSAGSSTLGAGSDRPCSDYNRCSLTSTRPASWIRFFTSVRKFPMSSCVSEVTSKLMNDGALARAPFSVGTSSCSLTISKGRFSIRVSSRNRNCLSPNSPATSTLARVEMGGFPRFHGVLAGNARLAYSLASPR